MNKKKYMRPATCLYAIEEKQAMLAGSDLREASKDDGDYTDENLGKYWESGTKDLWGD